MARRREDRETIKRLREVWDYDPDTGAFIRKEKQRGGSKPSIRGDVGGITTNGYRLISLNAVHYLAHRLAWAYMKDEWPVRAIEHINGNKLDNRIANLREKWGGKVALTAERLREVLDYDPETGIFTWKVRSPRANIGQVAGCETGNGYWFISVDGDRQLAHRLAWLYVHGKWPKSYVDHINGNRLDNRIVNLRDVTNSVNTHNTKKRRTSNILGYPGVSKAGNRYLSRMMVQNTVYHYGSFPTLAQARLARLLGEKQHFGHFTTWDGKRDGVLPLGDQFLAVIVRDNCLFLVNDKGEQGELRDIKELQVLPITDDGSVIH